MDDSVTLSETRPRVLLVEDERTVREHLARMLSDEFEVETAVDGEEALRCALRTRPNLIVTDIVMPQLSGIEFLRTLRNTPTTQAIPCC